MIKKEIEELSKIFNFNTYDKQPVKDGSNFRAKFDFINVFCPICDSLLNNGKIYPLTYPELKLDILCDQNGNKYNTFFHKTEINMSYINSNILIDELSIHIKIKNKFQFLLTVIKNDITNEFIAEFMLGVPNIYNSGKNFIKNENYKLPEKLFYPGELMNEINKMLLLL